MSECIEWSGSRNREGYGRFKIAGQSFLAHRIMWEEANGPIPDGLNICHTCDNPPCVNVDHLFLGTDKDNTRDSMAKGRRPSAFHGGLTMYRRYGCRCDRCKLAARKQHRKEYVRAGRKPR